MKTPAEFHKRAMNMPAYWFVRLETAAAEGDFEQAAQAQRELRRLGYEVRRQGPVRSESIADCVL